MGKKQQYRILSWNVNGIRAIDKKGFSDWLTENKNDIICLQETKAQVEQLPEHLLHPNGFESYWNSAVRPGYSGTSIYTKISPTLAVTNFGNEALDGEGRIVMLEYQHFYLFNVYFPNSGQGPARLKFKMKFYEEFLKMIERYRKKKPIVFCGDVNTAHEEIDLARPKENAKSAGFLPIERKWIDTIIEYGYIDTFRIFEKAGGYYTWWDYRTFARPKNIGWRIDYFFVSKELKSRVQRAWIEADMQGSDHCPVGVELRF